MRFFRLHICINTHLPHFGVLAYILPHFDALTLMLIRVSSAFIFQTFAEVCYSVFVKCSSFKSLLNLCKVHIFLLSLLKVNYRSVFAKSFKAFIFQKFRRPLYHKVNLPSCVHVHVAWRSLCHKVNLPSCVHVAWRLLWNHHTRPNYCTCWDEPYDITSLQDFFIMIHSLNGGFAVSNPYV